MQVTGHSTQYQPLKIVLEITVANWKLFSRQLELLKYEKLLLEFDQLMCNQTGVTVNTFTIIAMMYIFLPREKLKTSVSQLKSLEEKN